jgi:hypothetical protein
MLHRCLAALSPLVVTACSSSPSSVGSPGVTVSTELTVGAEEELLQCQLVTLPADADIEVVGISHGYTTGSHHFLVFTTDLDTVPPDLEGSYDCVRGNEPIMQHARGVLYGAQSPTGGTMFPDGVGFPMKAHQILLLQTHYINPSANPVDAKVSATFLTAPAETVTQRAGFLIFYDPFIYVPAQGQANAGIHCDVTGDITLISAFTHYHQRGTGMKVWVDPNATSQNDTPFYATNNWEHPQDYHGSLSIGNGSILRMQCDYLNTDSFDVFQGPNAATSEMCVFASLYYPELPGDFDFCTNLSVAGTGDQNCSDLLSCVQSCSPSDAPEVTPGATNVGGCWEKCVARGCAGATDALLPVSTCGSQACAEECSGGADACTLCIGSKCTAEITACLGHSCSP